MFDQGVTSKPHVSDTSSETSSTELSSTNAICGEVDTEYQDTEDYVAPSPSTNAVEDAGAVEETTTSLGELVLGESDAVSGPSNDGVDNGVQTSSVEDGDEDYTIKSQQDLHVGTSILQRGN
jgi:hypothetical protein